MISTNKNSNPNISVELCDIKLRNPLILAPGPTSRDGACLKKAGLLGAGAVTTKTITYEAAKVPRPYLAKTPQGIINHDKWSDIAYKGWVEKEIPHAKEAGIPLIASIKSIKNDVGEIVKISNGVIEAGADMIEIVATYSCKPLPKLIKAVKKEVDIPVLAKLVLEDFDLSKIGLKVERAGADAVSCMDTLGPCLSIDVETSKPLMWGRLSGAGIKPFTVYQVHNLARKLSIPIIGVGGIMNGKDVIEMMMAGATAIGICSATLIHGLEIFKNINQEIVSFLIKHDYNNIQKIIGIMDSENFLQDLNYKVKPPILRKENCIKCGLCEQACPHNAISILKEINLDKSKCHGCGLCYTVCPNNALINPY